jgi:hypothetical protein
MSLEKFNTIYKTEQGESEKEIKKQEPEKKDTNQEEIELIKSRYEELAKWGNVLLGREGWSMEINPAIPTAAADFENKILYFGTKCEDIIADPDMGKQDLKRLFVFSHEVMHFAQALEAPEEYLSTFDIAEEKAKEFSQKYGGNKRDLQESFRTFFSIFLDIDDNGKVVRRNKKLQKDQGQEATTEIYQKLFSEKNLSDDPLNEQYMYAAIMKIMDEDRDLELSSEVSELLEGEFRYLGKRYKSLIEFVKKEVNNPDIPFKKSLFRIKKILQPQFEALLKKDLENNNYRKIKNKKRENDIDGGIEEGMLKDFIEGVLKEKASTTDKAKNQMRKDFEKKSKKEGFSERDIREMERVMRNTDNVWPQMIDLWEKFFAISKAYIDKEEGYFYSGQTFSTKKFVHDLPKFAKDVGSVKPFKRNITVEEQESWKPKKISLIFSTDLSGSMDDAKRQAVQEAYYCIAKSFIQFQRNQIIKSDQDKSPVEGYIRNIGFGSDMQDLLKLAPEEKETRFINPQNKTLDKRIWQSILDIGRVDLKNNDDPSYLTELKKEAEKSKHDLENNEESMVIVELTDGDPDSNVKNEGKKVVEELNKIENVFCRAIRIGGSSNDFEEIWGDKGEVLPDGDVANLKEVFMKILKEIFIPN